MTHNISIEHQRKRDEGTLEHPEIASQYIQRKLY